MFIDYACYNKILTKDVKEDIFKAAEMGIHGISLPITFLSKVSSILPDSIILSCPIDYPNGYGDTNLRIHYAMRAFHYGADAIDIVVNTFLYYNIKSEFISDLKAIISLAKDKKMIPRIMIDNKKLINVEDFKKILKVISSMEVDQVFCSNGQYSEDPVDNIILCKSAQKIFGLNAIANGNFYAKDQVQIAKDAKLFGIRFNNIETMKRCLGGV